jgi:hypothetical protein
VSKGARSLNSTSRAHDAQMLTSTLGLDRWLLLVALPDLRTHVRRSRTALDGYLSRDARRDVASCLPAPSGNGTHEARMRFRLMRFGSLPAWCCGSTHRAEAPFCRALVQPRHLALASDKAGRPRVYSRKHGSGSSSSKRQRILPRERAVEHASGLSPSLSAVRSRLPACRAPSFWAICQELDVGKRGFGSKAVYRQRSPLSGSSLIESNK